MATLPPIKPSQGATQRAGAVGLTAESVVVAAVSLARSMVPGNNVASLATGQTNADNGASQYFTHTGAVRELAHAASYVASKVGLEGAAETFATMRNVAAAATGATAAAVVAAADVLLNPHTNEATTKAASVENLIHPLLRNNDVTRNPDLIRAAQNDSKMQMVASSLKAAQNAQDPASRDKAFGQLNDDMKNLSPEQMAQLKDFHVASQQSAAATAKANGPYRDLQRQALDRTEDPVTINGPQANGAYAALAKPASAEEQKAMDTCVQEIDLRASVQSADKPVDRRHESIAGPAGTQVVVPKGSVGDHNITASAYAAKADKCLADQRQQPMRTAMKGPGL